jgi:uncharacterized membrane protein
MARSDPEKHPEVVLSLRRALVAVGLGIVAGIAVVFAGEAELMPVVAWVVAILVVLTWVWRIIWPQDHVGTERLAEGESRSRTTDTAVLVSAVVSLGAVVLALVRSTAAPQTAATVSVVLSVLAVALSWALVNTVFALKYARLYYVDTDGGIDFPQREPPAYTDFAYMAFTIGMSFAVSDTAVNTRSARKTVLAHAVLSYVLGTGILATAINLVPNLGQG